MPHIQNLDIELHKILSYANTIILLLKLLELSKGIRYRKTHGDVQKGGKGQFSDGDRLVGVGFV